MAYLVEKLADRGCITIADNASILVLAELLQQHNIGAVMAVGKNETPTGIVSERDIVRCLTNANTDKETTIVSEIMSKNFIPCDLSTTSSELMEIMTRHKIRHIPIVENKKLLGMVSIGDVVSRLIDIYGAENEQLRTYINS
jgi:CBS domain-containing protein|tara:strand:- start:1 stop:426 length:426 start_codon:yes stop_codon:yes gene_type:complete